MEQNYFREPEYPFFDKLKKGITLFVNLSLSLALSFLLIRIFEIVYTSITKQTPTDIWNIFLYGFAFDLVFWLKLLPFLCVPFLLLFLTSRFKRSNFWGYGILGTLLLISYLALIKYFQTALVPLGADLFGYSKDEIIQTIGTGATFDILTLVSFLIVLGLFWIITDFFYKKQFVKSSVALGILFSGLLLIWFDLSALPKQTSFNNDFSYNLSLNKEAFFFEKTMELYSKKEPETDIYAINFIDDAEADSISGYKSFKYIHDEYPFLRKDETPDVLGNFFKIDSLNPPDIVFIQVEGLGRAFSGPNAYLGSFTPFLDSLASKSLYWKNFLSSQGRTFASLPSVLGSLPFAEKGFADMEPPMPNHLTLYTILRKNGYDTRFYSGFDLKFDNEGNFLKRQGVRVKIGEKDYDKSFVKSPKNAAGFTWGYPDRELFRKTLHMQRSVESKTPAISYIQTVSMHTPYTIPNQALYRKMFEAQLNELHKSKAEKKQYRQYADIYSTILYTDEALKYFFNQYAKLPSFKNTIFIITGDHRLPEIPMASKIDRYHVPLLVYSPLLKRTAYFNSISSHVDITPSMLAFLKKNYKAQTPDIAAWVGSGLDTARTLRNIHKYPMMQTKNDLVNYISGLYFLDQDVVFEIKDNLDTEPIQDDGKLGQLKTEFNQYIQKNKKLIKGRKLIPDTLYSKYR